MGQTVEITVTTTSTQGSPVNGSVTVGRGIMKNIFLYFAQGINGTNFCIIKKGANQLFPRTASATYRLVQSPIQIFDQEPLTDASTIITLSGWASGANYSHVVRLSFDLIPFDLPELII